MVGGAVATLTLNGNTYLCQPNETVLDCLLKHNVRIPHSCRQGLCQSCLLRCLDTAPPALAQLGLKNTLQQQNYFLACLCQPEQDMQLALANTLSRRLVTAKVVNKQWLAPDIVRLVLHYDSHFKFAAGQFINVQRDDGLTRSYSIANIPRHDNTLELHIRRLANGQFSSWVHDDLDIASELTLSEAQGSCHYVSGKPEQPLLLIGTGTGLAPLYGIITDALTQGHSAPIHLFHGSRDSSGLYLSEDLRQLAEKFSQFHYTPCLSGTENISAYAQGRAHQIALATLPKLTGWRVYLCGHPEMVTQSQKMAYLQGAALKDIYTDAFHVKQTNSVSDL